MPSDKSAKQRSLPLFIGKSLYFLLPIPVACLSLSLISVYMQYYDIGVNAAANNSFLVFFVAPILILTLYTVAAFSLYLVYRYFNSQWLGILLGGVLVLAVGVAAFLFEVQSTLDYPTEKPKNMQLFLKYYMNRILEQ